jgi:hypothetical protein
MKTVGGLRGTGYRGRERVQLPGGGRRTNLVRVAGSVRCQHETKDPNHPNSSLSAKAAVQPH